MSFFGIWGWLLLLIFQLKIIINSFLGGAKDILNNEPHFVKPVGGTLTLYEIDRRIKRAKEIKN